MAKVGAQWRGFVSAIGIACLAGGVAMWSMGWLDRDVSTIGRDVLSGVRNYLDVDEVEGMEAPERAQIYYSDGGSTTVKIPNSGFGFGGDSYERMLSNHASRGAVVGTVEVLDGDTLVLNGKTIRLWGVDAPELKQPCARDGFSWLCGQDAKAALRTFIDSRRIACYDKGLDRNGRQQGQCFAGDFDLAGWQVRNGWAMAVRALSNTYAPSEAGAKYKRLGIWRDSGILAPWEWRKHN